MDQLAKREDDSLARKNTGLATVNAGNAWVRSVLGDRRTGKSYFARHSLLASNLGRGSLGLVWTPNGPATDPCDIKGMVDMSAEELINSDRCPMAVCLRGEDAETACQLAVAAAQKFRVTLLIDEAHEVFPENFSPKSEAAALFHRGRHLGINLIVVSQWPAKLSKTVLRASESVYWFRLHAYEDLKWIAKRYGEQAATEVANLEQYHHICVVGDDLPESWKQWQLKQEGDGAEVTEPLQYEATVDSDPEPQNPPLEGTRAPARDNHSLPLSQD